jgi:hypothetical protein
MGAFPTCVFSQLGRRRPPLAYRPLHLHMFQAFSVNLEAQGFYETLLKIGDVPEKYK